MARFVIDARTLLHIVTDGVTISSAHQLVAPNLIRSQALTLLLAEVRSGQITEEVALQRHERLTEIKMRLLGDRVSRRTAWKIARQQGWATTFDAEYLPSAHCRPTCWSRSTQRWQPELPASFRWLHRRSRPVTTRGRPTASSHRPPMCGDGSSRETRR